MANEARWGKAQNYEKRHWENVARKVATGVGDLDWYRTRSERMLATFRDHGIVVDEKCNVAEIGSGPVGVIGFVPGAKRYAVDPLMDYYSSEESLREPRDPDVSYLAAKGEDIPIPDGDCDLVIIDNCLDHCEDPGKVLDECRRILRRDATLYLTLNVRSPMGWTVRNAMELFEIDPGHPHSYYPRKLRNLIGQHGFEEQGFWLQPWKESFDRDWAHNAQRTSLKVLTFTLERLARGIWRAV